MKFKKRKYENRKLNRKTLIKKEKLKKVLIKDEYNKANKFNCLKNKLIFFILLLIFLFIISIIIYLLLNNSSSSNIPIKISDKNYKVDDTTDEKTYFQIIQDFIYINTNGTLLYDYKNVKKIDNPKISIVITIHNAQTFIKSALRSVQNQDFQDIEIIMVEDSSIDDSVKIIKEFMNEDPRIRLIFNDKDKGNRGYLFTMLNGILNAKGKYVMVLDVDDLFAVENVFSTIYNEIEKYDIDALGFSATQGILDMISHIYTHTSFHNYIETSILNQPEIRERVTNKDERGNYYGSKDVIWGYIYKTDFLIKVVKEIDEKFLNIIFNHYGDFFLFFLISRRAKTLKYIKKLFYVTIQQKKSGDSFEKYFTKEKAESRKENRCKAFFGYIELVVCKSGDDVKYASYLIQNNFVNDKECLNNEGVKEQVISICKLVLDNKSFENGIKDKINSILQNLN